MCSHNWQSNRLFQRDQGQPGSSYYFHLWEEGPYPGSSSHDLLWCGHFLRVLPPVFTPAGHPRSLRALREPVLCHLHGRNVGCSKACHDKEVRYSRRRGKCWLDEKCSREKAGLTLYREKEVNIAMRKARVWERPGVMSCVMTSCYITVTSLYSGDITPDNITPEMVMYLTRPYVLRMRMCPGMSSCLGEFFSKPKTQS